MLNVTIKQMRYFSALAKYRHFSQAANACAITQPALSMQLRELEETLGCALIEKGTRPMRLTDTGLNVLKSVDQILGEVENIEEFTRASADRPMHSLRFGVIPTIAPYLLPEIITQLKSRFEDIALNIQEAKTEQLLESVREGRLDCAIMALPVSEPTLSELELFREEFVLVRPSEDAHKPVPNPENLRKMRLLLLQEGHCFRDQALEFCKISPPVPHELMDGSSLSTLVQMVGAGLGITLIPQMAVNLEQRAASVSVAAFAEPRPFRRVGMVWRKTNPIQHHLLEVAKALRNDSNA